MPPRAVSILRLLNDIKNGELALPDLQRDFVWREEDVRLLLDSIMRGYPFGLMLFWNTQFVEVAYREFVTDYQRGQTFASRVKPKGQSIRLVLDGQQRLQSLFIAVFGTYDGRRMYFNVTSGPRSEPIEDDSVGRGYRFEFWRDDEPNRPKRLVRVADLIRWPAQTERSELRKLIDSLELDGDEAELARDNVSAFRSLLRDEIVPVSTIDDHVHEAEQAMPIEHVLEIFVRVNQGGTKLTRSDLMFSLIKTRWGSARSQFDSLLSDVNRVGALAIDKDFLILGLLAISEVPISADVENVQRHWETMEPQFEALERGLRATIDFCRSRDARIFSARLLPVNALLPIVYFLSKQPNGSVPDGDGRNLRTLLYFLLFNGFMSSRSPHARMRYLREVFRANPSNRLPLDALLGEFVRRQKGAITTSTVEMLAWSPALTLNIAQPAAAHDTVSWQAEPQIDHVFPQSVYRPLYGDLVDDIGNLSYLGRLPNIRKSATPPWEYFRDVSDDELRDDYLIDRALLTHDCFPQFVAARRQLILERVCHSPPPWGHRSPGS